MGKGPWTLVLQRADGKISHVLTTPHEAVAHREAEAILLRLKALGQHRGITAHIIDKDSANQPGFEVPATSRSIVVPSERK